MPAGSSDRPDFRAASAPASTTSVPVGFSEPAIQRLRAVFGSEAGRNHEQVPPSRIACSGFMRRPSAIAMRQPALIAMRAAASLVTMPPDEYPVGAPPAMDSM